MHFILASSMLLCCPHAPGRPSYDAPPPIEQIVPTTDDLHALDPQTMFDLVMRRYRDISMYEDRVIIEQITARDGRPAVREQTTVHCAIRKTGEIDIKTDAEFLEQDDSQEVAEDANDTEIEPTVEATSALHMQYQLWLAPHMALRFHTSPLEKFRTGITEGFTPVAAERVTIEDQELLRLDLQSGDGLSGDFRAKFELFINPDTMLIRRVRGVQLLPDGANLLTDFHITPKRVVTSDGREITPIIRRIGAAV